MPTSTHAFAFGLLVALAATIPGRAATAADTPHIVIILVDDMGYGDPGCFNPQSKIPTPYIDSIARQGMRFTDAHAPGPLCHMSRYGLLTGRYPFRTQVGRWPEHALIEPDQITIASLAKSQGYATAMVGKWHVGFDEQGYDAPLPGGPVDRGFDSFFGIRASTDIPPYFYIRNDRAISPPTNKIAANNSEGWSPIQGAFWRAGGIAPDLQLHDVLPRFTDEAIEVVNRHAAETTEKPLLLYLAYPAPHTPWLPSEEFVGQSGASMYGDFMMMVDAQIGRVLSALRATDMERDTLVIFTSDNGPTWYPVDVERFGHDSAAGLRGMKADAWEAGHRMPFIVRWPGEIDPASTSDATICFTDFLATFADLWDTDLPAGAGPDSYSFLPAILNQPTDNRADQQQPSRPPIVMQSGNGRLKLIRSGDWKLITGLGSGGFTQPNHIVPGPGDPPGQLYNLASDRGETTNLYDQHPDIVARLTAEMEQVVGEP